MKGQGTKNLCVVESKSVLEPEVKGAPLYKVKLFMGFQDPARFELSLPCASDEQIFHQVGPRIFHKFSGSEKTQLFSKII